MVYRKGLQQGLQQSIFQALEERFGAVPETIIRKVESLEDPERLRWLIRQAIRVESLGSFEALLDEMKLGE